MIRFLADENFNQNIVRGLELRDPEIRVVRAVDAGLRGAEDPAVLEYAAVHGLVLLTHDLSTLTGYAYERVAAGLRMPGVFEVPEWLAIGAVIEDLLVVARASLEGEWEGQVRFLPLR